MLLKSVHKLNFHFIIFERKKRNEKKCQCIRTWSVRGSNSRPWRYQHHALPTELTDLADQRAENIIFKVRRV